MNDTLHTVSTDVSTERNWAAAAHLAALVAAFLTSWSAGIAGAVAALVVWLIVRDRHPFASEHAKEALNFHISILIYSAVCVVTCVAAPLAIGVGIFGIVFAIIAAVKSGEPIPYRYPLTLRLIK
jgi:uncharacterized Tic20 family protein